jgi:CHASE3 domain sensor protein
MPSNALPAPSAAASPAAEWLKTYKTAQKHGTRENHELRRLSSDEKYEKHRKSPLELLLPN